MLVFLVAVLGLIALIDLVCYYTVKFQLEKLKYQHMGPGVLPAKLPKQPQVHLTISGKNRLTSAVSCDFAFHDTLGIFMRLVYDKELHQYDLISINGVDTSPRDAENVILVDGMNIKLFESIG